ncbi:50S ribosomal protein L28 [Koleobacter methoxysyntrophicus]|jgi:large subunit ribosomal protein L28|uniref:Large ribosomal subunit protein bL28 n=1 Tax=Koleobacter methoxysyntrophicus TaxID=2751313 RepID=A0A8A0RQK0_9FIRM|nr:50S ribosomal protein L28 [Koleobacter methoxysyntrophicus]QSQ09828.1 50S ribosomal protein L28 [Koleobacter methoxysyntrophicus]
MANKCDVCGKAPLSGNKVSHSNIKSKRKWAPNIKKIKAVVNNSTKRINVCTRCLRTGKVKRAI